VRRVKLIINKINGLEIPLIPQHLSSKPLLLSTSIPSRLIWCRFSTDSDCHSAYLGPEVDLLVADEATTCRNLLKCFQTRCILAPDPRADN